MPPKEGLTTVKFDANTEAFQMRAQWHKAEICRQQWFDKWSWLLEERKVALDEANAIRQAANIRQVKQKLEFTKSLKPVPPTSTGQIGWLSSRPDCQLEVYTSWLAKPPVHLPDAWDNPNYLGKRAIEED